MIRPHPAIAIATVAAVACLMRPGSLSAAPGFGEVSILVGGYEIFGRLADGSDGVADARVTGTLADAVGNVRATAAATTTDDGGFELTFITNGLGERQPVRIQPGDSVRLDYGAIGGRWSVPTFYTEDYQADVLTGRAPAGSDIMVTVNTPAGDYASQNVRADSADRWRADFTGSLRIEPLSHGVALYRDGPVTWQTDWTVHGVATAVGADVVTLNTWPGGQLRVTLSGGDPEVATIALGHAAAWDRAVPVPLRSPAGARAVVAPGSTLTWRDDVWPWAGASVVIPALTVEVDPDADTVRGTGAPGLRVKVQLPGGSRSLSVDAAGNWALALPDALLAEDTPVLVTLPDYPHVSWRAFAPRVVTMDPYEARVTGRGVAGTPVSLRVHRAGRELGRASGTVAADGSFALVARSADGLPVPRAAGDTWRVSHGQASLAYPIAPFSATADGGSRRVSGSASPGATVRVGVGGETLTVVAGTDGRWSAQLPPTVDMPPGTRVEAATQYEGGPTTRLAFPTFRASVPLRSSAVHVEGPAGLTAQVAVERDGSALGGGHCTVARTECEAPIFTDTGQAITLTPGDSVAVYPSDGTTAALDLVRMTAHIDLNGHDVVGEAPPDATLRILFGHEPGLPLPLDATTWADSTGVFDHELSPSEWGGLTAGLWADVWLPTPSGHQQLARGVLEVLRATPGSATVTGSAEPGSPVTLTLVGSGTRAATGSDTGSDTGNDNGNDNGSDTASAGATAGATGRYTATLRDAAGQVRAVAPGDALTAAHNRGTRHFVAEPLAAWREGSAGEIGGLAGPNRAVRAVYHLRSGALAGSTVVVAGVSDAAGEFVLPAPRLDMAEVVALDVVATLADGDELVRPLAPDAAPGRVFLPTAFVAAPQP